MSKIVTSPVERWPGEVTLSDPLSFPQAFAWEDALIAAAELYEVKEQDGERGEPVRVVIPRPGVSFQQVNFAMLPAALKCVEAWDLEGFPAHPTPESFPASPKSVRRDSARLIAWLIGEIGQLFSEADPDPNE